MSAGSVSPRIPPAQAAVPEPGRPPLPRRRRGVGGGLAAEHSSRGAAFGDYDNDGDIDVLVVNMNEPPSLLRNDTTGGGHWITLKLWAPSRPARKARPTATRSARGSGCRPAGARRSARCGAAAVICRITTSRMHFGLGDADRVARVEIRWPSGRMRNADGPCRRSVLRCARGARRTAEVVRGFSPAVTRRPEGLHYFRNRICAVTPLPSVIVDDGICRYVLNRFGCARAASESRRG